MWYTHSFKEIFLPQLVIKMPDSFKIREDLLTRSLNGIQKFFGELAGFWTFMAKVPHQRITIIQLFNDIAPVTINQLTFNAPGFTIADPTLTQEAFC